MSLCSFEDPIDLHRCPSLIKLLPRYLKRNHHDISIKKNTHIWNGYEIYYPEKPISFYCDHFTCTPASVIYCITCSYYEKLYFGETGRRLGDRFREHFRDVERNDKDASKAVAKHLNLPNHSKQHMAHCGLSLHQGS